MKILNQIIILCFTLNLAIGQEYLNESSKWREIQTSCPPVGLCFSSDYIIFIDGDTIINGIKYFKTYKFGTETVTSIITGTIISIDTFQNQLNPIREENKRFYKFDANSNQDVQFQRFDLETGDTLNTQANTPLIVCQIYTFYIGNEPKRKFSFINDGLEFLYEGIGSAQGGLFFEPVAGTGIESGLSLICYQIDNHLTQINDFVFCEELTHNSEIFPNEFNIKISPNPVKDYLTIALSESINSGSDILINILDIQGKLLIKDKINHGEYHKEIYLNDLPNNIYFVALVTKSGIIIKKIIKN